MKFTRLIKMSLASVWNNKMRSFLTMLGIIIGISSVIILVGMGQGTQKQISYQI
jgi:putative ABC transport system permease protein